MKKYYYLLITFLLLSITGCSTRQYYKPDRQHLQNEEVKLNKDLSSDIIFFTRDSATLKDGIVIPKNKRLKNGFIALNSELAKKGNILLIIKKNREIKFNKLIVQASKNGNLLAVTFSDNSFELLDLKKNRPILKNSFDTILGAERKFVAPPLFYKELIVIPTLDGKLEIFDIKNRKFIREIVVSKKDYFNNIIFLGVVNNTLIAASRDNIISIKPGTFSQQPYNIKHILVGKYDIYIFSVEGEIVKLNLELKKIKSINFPFAEIIAPTMVGKYIYFISHGKEDYLIKIDRGLKNYKIYNLDAPSIEDNNAFVKDGILYIKDKFINLKSIK